MKVSIIDQPPLFLPVSRLKGEGVFLQDTLFLDPNAVLLEASKAVRKSWQALGELIRKKAAEGKQLDHKRAEKSEAQRASELVTAWILSQRIMADITYGQNVTRLSHLSVYSSPI